MLRLAAVVYEGAFFASVAADRRAPERALLGKRSEDGPVGFSRSLPAALLVAVVFSFAVMARAVVSASAASKATAASKAATTAAFSFASMSPTLGAVAFSLAVMAADVAPAAASAAPTSSKTTTALLSDACAVIFAFAVKSPAEAPAAAFAASTSCSFASTNAAAALRSSDALAAPSGVAA